MIQKSLFVNIALCLVVLGFGEVMLCGSCSLSSASEIQFALEIKPLRTVGISGSFTQDGRTLFFETRRGERNPNPTNDTDIPPFAIDIRIMDGNRVPFLVQTAGHTPMEFTWKKEQEAFEGYQEDEVERFFDFSLLPDMAKALESYKPKYKKYVHEINSLICLLNSISSNDLFKADYADSTVKLRATTYYLHDTSIYNKPAFLNGVPADHSALSLRIYNSSGSLRKYFTTCNHGTCAHDSSMSFKCKRRFNKDHDKVYMWDLMCDSLGSSYGITKGKHVCNNDTRQEYLSTKNSSTKDHGVCKTGWLRYAPNCE